MVGGGGGQGPILNSASREGITRLHKDVSRLQRNAWQVRCGMKHSEMSAITLGRALGKAVVILYLLIRGRMRD